MGERVIKLPDVGEGVAEAELVEWHVKVGDLVREDEIVAAVMTDKATVEIPAPTDGEIVWLGGETGDVIAVGSPIVRIKTSGGDGESTSEDAEKPMDDGEAEAPIADGMSEEGEDLPPPQGEKAKPPKPEKKPQSAPQPAARSVGAPWPQGEKPLASPAVRLRAREAGIDLRQVSATGPAGRITHDDIDLFQTRGPQRAGGGAVLQRRTDVEDVKIVGLRRKIAEKMATAKRHIPHITYVEEIDMTASEELRAALNKGKRADQPKLTILPFLMRAMVKAIGEYPQFNAHFDDEAGVVHRHGGVHIGIAAQTPSGLVVPVAKHCEARDLWDCGAEVNRLSEAAKSGTATREELSGSTITITSLGALGGVVTTPVINHPEVAIIGVNKMAIRAHWDGTDFVPRKMMNLSSGFDHRIIDGWDAAVFVQRIKTLLEMPAMIFVEG